MTSQNKILRFTMFGLLYFTQGTILGYFASLNAIYLLKNGLSIADVGIFSTIALIPFIIKILFGILSDRYNFLGWGHRKPYIVMGLLVQFICLIVVMFINPGTQYWLFVGIAFLLQLGMAFYDTCTDGLALDVTPADEKGILQGFMVGGRSIGVIVAASVAGIIAESSWQGVFLFLAALTLLPFLLLFFIKEPERTPGTRFNWGAFRAFKKPVVLLVAAIGLIVFLVIVGANQLVNPSLSTRLGISTSTAGLLTTLWGIGCVAGALAGGRLMDRLGGKRALWLSILSVAVTMVLIAIIPSLVVAYLVVILFGVAYGASQAIYFALAMQVTDGTIAASMYSILMAVTNVGQGIGLGLGGGLADAAGYPAAFLAFGGIIFLAVPFVIALYRRFRPRTTEDIFQAEL
ncbi:MAG TPA: MFS transporter, partial [Anaerolineaceae bacterium]|nr:MFS transporter [Anaerolineaceae bacterium]HPA32591.1 MFS transporter [Anaerolineaceae bacterium]HQO97453.1 MFS transporter [Anaerolineaceae bacterium]HQP61147.1 MFS transporter [Anaerolineaceae bacterium]